MFIEAPQNQSFFILFDQAVPQLFEFAADAHLVDVRVFEAFVLRGQHGQAFAAVLRRLG